MNSLTTTHNGLRIFEDPPRDWLTRVEEPLCRCLSIIAKSLYTPFILPFEVRQMVWKETVVNKMLHLNARYHKQNGCMVLPSITYHTADESKLSTSNLTVTYFQ